MNFEFSILNSIQNLRTPLLDIVMTFITKLGNMGIIWIIIGIFFLMQKNKKNKLIGTKLLLSLIISTILGSLILKPIIARKRPSWIHNIDLLIKNPRDFSFPSGHTYSGFASATAVFRKKRFLGTILYILAFLIAFSRMYLYVHFPTDIIAGIILGFFSEYIAEFIVSKILMRQKHAQR